MRSIKENWKKLNNLDGILFDIWIRFSRIIFFLHDVEVIPVASPHGYHSQILTNNTEKQSQLSDFQLSLSLPEKWRQHYFYWWEDYSRIGKSEYIELLDVTKYVHVETHRTNETDDEVKCRSQTHWEKFGEQHVWSGEGNREPSTWRWKILLIVVWL